jgi:hypothetical protein
MKGGTETMSRKKNTNWKRTVKKQAGREEVQDENRRGLLRRLSPEARPAPASAPVIAAAPADKGNAR